MWKVYLLEFVVVLIISLLWANGIASMHEKHPDYKGKDFFNEEEEEDLDDKTPDN